MAVKGYTQHIHLKKNSRTSLTRTLLTRRPSKLRSAAGSEFSRYVYALCTCVSVVVVVFYLIVKYTSACTCRGGSKVSEKGIHIYEGVWVRFADFISFFLNIPWKWNNLVSVRPYYFIFIGYLKTGARRGFERTPRTPSGPPLTLVEEESTSLYLV